MPIYRDEFGLFISNNNHKREQEGNPEILDPSFTQHMPPRRIQGLFGSTDDSLDYFNNVSIENHTMSYREEEEERPTIFYFPIRGGRNDKAKMKIINLVALLNFHGLTSKDPDTFLLEFKVVCRTYDYTMDAQKLKIFPSTLKDSALRWLMSLEPNNIFT